MSTRVTNRRIREILEVAQLTRFEFKAQIILLVGTSAIAFLATRLWFIPIWVVLHYFFVALERMVTRHFRESDSQAALALIIALNLCVGMTFAAMPVYLWHQNQDMYQFAGMVLLVGSTLNTFLVRSQLWFQAVCFVGPNSLAIILIAVDIARKAPTNAGAITVLVIAVAIVTYLGIAVVQGTQAHRRFVDTRDRLMQSQKMEALGNLAGGMAHDFNNILNVIMATLELAQEETDIVSIRRSLEQARRSADRGSSLIRQVLSFARKSRLEANRLDPRAVMETVESMSRRLIPERIGLSFAVSPEVRAIRTDEGALVSAILNLVLNARDAIEGKGEIGVTCFEATGPEAGSRDGVSEAGSGHIAFRIRDSGRGIPAEMISRVTDPFFTTKRNGEGTGLGLSMVAGFAAQSGGDLRIDSTPGKGTSVTILLPVDDRPPPDVEPPPVAALAAPRLNGRSVLVVEDQHDLRELVVRYLTRIGHDVLGAASGDEAQALLDRGLTPDVVLSDIVMPGSIQGRELARLVRERLPGTAVVLMSGFDHQEFGEGVTDSSEFEFLPKPVRLADLGSVIERLSNPRMAPPGQADHRPELSG